VNQFVNESPPVEKDWARYVDENLTRMTKQNNERQFSFIHVNEMNLSPSNASLPSHRSRNQESQAVSISARANPMLTIIDQQSTASLPACKPDHAFTIDPIRTMLDKSIDKAQKRRDLVLQVQSQRKQMIKQTAKLALFHKKAMEETHNRRFNSAVEF
jgi:pyruvate formate-lyase activating enzyme-like uncharacterized protein